MPQRTRGGLDAVTTLQEHLDEMERIARVFYEQTPHPDLLIIVRSAIDLKRYVQNELDPMLRRSERNHNAAASRLRFEQIESRIAALESLIADLRYMPSPKHDAHRPS